MNYKVGTPKRIKLKIFTQAPTVDLQSIVPIFHRWIREQSVPGLLIDVANYAHVVNGPGLMLIGHEADYAIDLADGRPGLLYDRKRNTSDNLQADLATFLQHTLTAVDTLERGQTVNPTLLFDRNQIEIIFSDRLYAPNTPETFAALHPDIEAALKQVIPNGTFTINRVDTEQRRPLTIRATITQSTKITTPNTVALTA